MTRKELVTSTEYWLVQFQNDLYGVMEDYMKKNKLNRTQLAEKLGVNKAYVSQILNGNFDHKTSKLIELSLDCGKIPLLFFVDKEDFLKADAEDKFYEIMPMIRAREIRFDTAVSTNKTDTPHSIYSNVQNEDLSTNIPKPFQSVPYRKLQLTNG